KADMGGLQRTLLCQGPVELTRGTKTNRRHLSLFDDVLVVSSNLNKKKFKIKLIIPLNNLWAVDNVELVRKNEFSLCKNLFLFWPDGSFLASFRSIEEKDHWYYFLRRSIDAAKMDMKKPFSLKIFTEDIPTCDTNSEDFELWFCPGHEEAPRALYGYECPHKVLMNHLQINLGRWKSKISTAFPILPGLFVKDFNMDEEGQFILKPRNSARIQQQNEKERPRKTKRPLMTSCFHRASVPHRDQMCTDPKVKKTGQLFGKQLSCICPNGKWPQAILDILYRLREKGPTTQSIFAKAPDETSCKTLKDKLDNGEVVAIKNYSLHDVAWILKEFLRLIKGSLMTAQLYDKWLAVPQKANHKEKLTAVRSLLDNLPVPNAALLGQLFRILHEISKNASFNLMSAQNLSAEIAPYILWMPTYRNKVLANYITEKISLVTFLISNSPELFGLDVVAVWYETSFFSPTSTNTSCAHNSPSIINKGKETEHGINTCPSGRTYSPGHDAPAITPVAPPLHEGNIEKGEGSVDTTQQAISKTAPAPIKKHEFRSFPPISCLDRMLPSPILVSFTLGLYSSPMSHNFWEPLF
ncbi:rho GTPase-activating protein 20-like, partial [Apodemus sylvaticus]|uniref:rho GTPase-activating protein 20-like n=1 Tax=Apodemus sylvaticus TaxID=10129 RepID=UPI0022433930